VNDDLTQKLPSSDGATLEQNLTIMQSLESRFEVLEKKVEERLYDARPIWEKVLVEIEELQQGQAELSEGQQQFWAAHSQLVAGQKQLQEGLQQLWEAHTQLVEGQKRLQEGQEFLRGEVKEIKTLVRDIFRRLSIFNDTLLTMQADYRDIYDRVRVLELNRT
jgi:uncharacterized phage infection (PIP) family protein YhgE